MVKILKKCRLTGNEMQDMVIKARHKYQLSQNMLAKYLDVTTQTIRNWEHGRHNVPGPALKILEMMLKNRD